MYKSPRSTSVKAVFAAASLVATLAVAAPAFAHNAGRHCGAHGGYAMHELRQINLTVPQQKAIRTAIKNSRTGKRAQFKALMQQRRAFENATPGTAQFNTAYGSYTQAAAAAAQAHIRDEADLRTQIYNLLNQAQREKLATLKSERD